jgi:hypothetical protein
MGDALISMGLLTPMEVFEALTRQMHLKFRNAIQMNNCTESFTPEPTSKNLDFNIQFYRCLIDGLKEFYTPERYKQEGQFNRDAIVRLNVQGKVKLSTLQLATDETKSLQQLDGVTKLGDFIARSPSKRTAAALIFFLNKLSYLEIISADKAVVTAQAAKMNEPAKSFVADVEFTSPGMALPEKNQPQPSESARSPETASMYSILLRMKQLNYYELLQVPDEAPLSQIERSYNILIKQHHLAQIEQHYKPEDQPNAKQLFDLFVTAYHTLMETKRRQLYTGQLKKPIANEHQLTDKNLLAEICGLKAEMALKFNNPKVALEYAQEASQQNPKEADYFVIMAQAQSKLDLLAEDQPSKKVEDFLRKAMEFNQQSHRAALELGYYYKLTKNSDKAETFFRKTLEGNPKCHAAEVELRLIEKRNEKKSQGLFSTFRNKKKAQS